MLVYLLFCIFHLFQIILHESKNNGALSIRALLNVNNIERVEARKQVLQQIDTIFKGSGFEVNDIWRVANAHTHTHSASS